MEKKVYILKNLGCAHCAAKIENKITKLPGVEEAAITFATKQLRLTARNPEELLPEINRIAHSLEPDIVITERQRKGASHTREHSGPEQEKHEHHHHEHSCGCGHDHEEHEHHHPNLSSGNPGDKKRVYILENLGCAHCAAKMEQKIQELPGVSGAVITFATKQLQVTGPDPDSLLKDMASICTSIEPEVTITPKDTVPQNKDSVSGKLSANTKSLLELGIGAVLFIAGEVLIHRGMDRYALIVLVAGYLLLGGRIVLTALKNLKNGQVFDENFLMSIATLGAFAIREYPEAVGVMLFYRVGEYFEHVAVEKSRSQIMDAVDLRPEVVRLFVDGDVREIPSQDAKAGDILVVRPGDRIPLDGVIIEGESQIDTSPVTGEPVPVIVRDGDNVTSGCVNTSGLLKIRVEKVLEESMVTRILDSVENAAASKPKIDRFITRFARVYTPFVVILAAATAIIPSLITGDWSKWVYTALTFLVISCPCALVLSVPLAFFSGIGAGSKKGILFKGGVSLEAMKNVAAVVMDKTGTITKGNFVLQNIHANPGVSQEYLLSLCASCEASSTHPIGCSIVSAARERKLVLSEPEFVKEIAGHGIYARLAEGDVLCGNQKLMEQYQVPVKDYQSGSFGTEVLVALNGRFIGYLVISDTLKEEAAPAISKIKALKIVTAMLTGDEKSSAQAVAKVTGIDEVHAKLLPQDKLEKLNSIRSQHGPVMFVGDGINDAPVLAGADVGAAMGSGADAAIEAADVVFMTSSMEAIPQALSIARATSRISWQNVIFALVIKALVMILGLAGFASMWMAVFADTGVAMICVLNSIRILYRK